ncbi:uncharacterized protein LOC123871187 [Maniola jurtina]|uniref:uncharacterized protein LOC123871187 n=1 Tax=Maniola jurtina TaxID=191418 RepID=UPI001E68DAC4|nr:uncharacterized protein LOC123871187 [Maniola jurtina]
MRDMKLCCVPHCTHTGPNNLHCLPMSGLKWKQWLKICPFLLNYSLRELVYMRICEKHFIREHIDYEKGRLRRDAIPLLHLTPHKPNNEANSVVIKPVQANEPVIFKVVSTTRQTGNTFIKCSSVENTKGKQEVKYLVCLKVQDTHGLPVDHNMYCLPSQADERPACLSSPRVMCLTRNKELLSSDRDLCAEPNQHNAESLSPKVECNMETESVAEETVTISDAQPWRFIVEEAKQSAASRGAVSVASQTVAGTQLPSQLGEHSLDFMSTNTKHSLIEDPKTEPVELLDSQLITLDNFQDNVFVLPDNIVVDKSTHSDRHKQSAVYVSPNVLNLLTSKSPLEKETIKSINIMFSTLKEQNNVPFNHNNPKLNIQPSVMKPTASGVQPAQKRTLETLVEELRESITAEETSELQASPAMAANSPARLLNPMSATAPCPLMQNLPAITQHPLTSNITEKRFCHTKENSSEKEQMLYRELKKLKRQLIQADRKNKLLKSRFKKLQETAKPYLKRYKRLTPKAKALIDTQLRLAGLKSKGARYTEEEKLFALKLHQISPDCYKFLQQYLILPNKKTMQSMPEFPKIA